MHLCAVETCAGVAYVVFVAPLTVQSEDLPINIKVTREKPGRGFGGRAAFGRLLTVQMLLL